MGILFECIRDELKQIVLDLQRGFTRRDPGAIGHPKNMGVNGDMRLTERSVEDNIGGFASDPGQFPQFVIGGRHPGTMFVFEDAAGLHNIFSFGVIQADGLDVCFEFF